MKSKMSRGTKFLVSHPPLMIVFVIFYFKKLKPGPTFVGSTLDETVTIVTGIILLKKIVCLSFIYCLSHMRSQVLSLPQKHISCRYRHESHAMISETEKNKKLTTLLQCSTRVVGSSGVVQSN
ncbi:hypothetical protein BJ875DRAFT_475703, partial [Amylocarpus encephaloides]